MSSTPRGGSGGGAGGGGGSAAGAGAGAGKAGDSAPSPSSTAALVMDALTKAAVMDASHSREFQRLYEQFISQVAKKRPIINWDAIHPVDPTKVLRADGLDSCPDDPMLHHELLQKVAIVKLNGGLGTTMGCRGPKSAIEVRSGLTFLDFTVKQVEFLNTKYGVDVPLILMNSFKTHDETIKIVRKYAVHHLTIHCFNQSCFPCIDGDHYSPIPTKPFTAETQHLWYPPGHGDVYRALMESGVLAALLRQGKEYLFISNVDNLGATVDLTMLYHILSNDIEFCMEVTDRTRSDIQGGVLVESGGKLKLLEASQVPANSLPMFNSIKTFNVFNTNNLWVSLRAVQRLVTADAMKPSLIISPRVLHGKKLLQLETAAGAAIEFFDKAVGIKVSRARFCPVKSTSDLLMVQSNLYSIRHGSLYPNPARESSTMPIIKLGPEFGNLAGYLKRMKFIPNLLDLDHLTVSGDVWFGRGVQLRGTVIIVANSGSRIDLPDGSEFEDRVVTGNLRILEH